MSQRFSAEVYKIKLVSPCYDEIDIEFRVYTQITTVHDLMQHIYEKKLLTFRPHEMKFLHKQLVMEQKRLLSSYTFDVSGDRISIIKILTPELMLDKGVSATVYSEFLRSSYPVKNSVDFSIDGEIVLNFGPSSLRGIELFVPALVDKNALQTSFRGDMVRNLGGLKEAKKRGYVAWTDEIFTQRAYLLEIPSIRKGSEVTDHLRFERIRYSTAGTLNMGYRDGDMHSWQRYTTKIPVLVSLLHTEEFDPITRDTISILSMRPMGGLKFNTCYAILLSNNVPTVPVVGCVGDFTEFTDAGTTEDHLIEFKTVPCSKT